MKHHLEKRLLTLKIFQYSSKITQNVLNIAKTAGLIYVNEKTPGIKRVRRGKGFTFYYPNGEPIHDTRMKSRIKSLVIPPAWEKVWICQKAEGHIQATGRDARGRKQYIYHPKWLETRNMTKYHRLRNFGRILPDIRKQVDFDLSEKNMSAKRATAFVVRLLDITHLRIGNREYMRSNRSYGLTTLLGRHLEISGSHLHFDFPAKGGKQKQVEIEDPKLARIARKFQELPGQELIRYRNDSGNYQTIESGDVNAYLVEVTGTYFTAKDFRTWGGTVIAASELCRIGPASGKTEAKKNIARAVNAAADHLGNTPAICRKYYIHPSVLDAYLKGDLLDLWSRHVNTRKTKPFGLFYEERIVMSILQDCVSLQPEDQ